MRALGSAILISPKTARLADTPPIVGSVRTEIYGIASSDNFASAALVLDI